MLYFRNCYFCSVNIIYRNKLVIYSLRIIKQILVKLSKIFRCHTIFVVVFAPYHAPKPGGLILKHFRSHCSKLQTCLLARPEICSSSCDAMLIPLPIFLTHHCHFPLSLPAGFVEPWCKGFAPFIGVFWCLYRYFFHNACTYRFL